jgi:hypothetical protein
MYSGALRYIYGFFFMFLLFMDYTYLQMYLHVRVCVFLTCVQDANLIYD